MAESERLYKPLKLKSCTIKGNILSAPLAGFSDRAYRHMAVEMGADLAYTEMVSCEALWRGSGKTEDLMERADNEEVYAIQLFAGNPESARKAIPFVNRKKPLLIDLNCGCPVPKILKSGAGSALMASPQIIGEIVRAMKSETGLPVTVKLRYGIRHGEPTFLEAAEEAQKAGAELITLHPRSQKQGYGGQAHWDCLRELKQNSSVPVVGSGDLFTPQDIRNMLLETGIDGAMPARGAIGNPHLFQRSLVFLQTGALPPEPSAREKVEAACRHLELAFHYFSENYAVKEMRKHLCSYTKGLPGSSRIRQTVVRCESAEEYRKLFDDYLERLEG